MATLNQWFLGARPWTLPAALAPVAAGTGAAAAVGGASPDKAFLALVVALALQVGVNYANDYSDGIRGTDENRIGPFRLTGSGSAKPSNVKRVAFLAFGMAAAVGGALIALCQSWWMLGVGAACILAAWFYTGGKHPYGYRGLGEVSVFIFFGLVAVLGTTYTQAGRISLPACSAAVGIGALACVLLLVNNLRDLPRDAMAGKHTLAVRLGDAGTRKLLVGLIAMAWLVLIPVIPTHPLVALTFLPLPMAVRCAKRVRGGTRDASLFPVLQAAGRLELAYGLLLGLSLWLGGRFPRVHI